ncbi:MAG: cardiolipin synthase, partial [Isosphaeraceae bacterium]
PQPTTGARPAVSDWLNSTDYWLLPEISTTLGFLLALIFLAYLIQQKRSPASTMAWLLLVVFLPYLGVPLYLMLGGRKLSRMARRKAQVYDRSQSQQPSRVDRNTERFLLSYGVPPASTGNRVELLTEGEEAFRHLVRIIDGARSTIHITTYILGKDRVGKEIMERLARRAAAGVSVRLLVDDLGSWRVRRRHLKPLLKNGVKVAFFMPMLHVPFRGRTNLRNHRKIIVVDSRIAITGGMNLAWPYLGPNPDPRYWRDLSAVVDGPAVADLESLFCSDWAFATGEEVTPPAQQTEDSRPPSFDLQASSSSHGCYVQVVASGPDVNDDPLYETIVSLIFAATERIWIVTPYFVPDEMLIRALNLAARRGVDVKLIVPARSNHLSADLARESYLRELHQAGGHILLYQPVMLHAKAIIFDNELAVIGSANMDNRSLFLNYEVALFLYSSDQVKGVSAWANALTADCLRELPKPGWSRELAENVVRLLSPLL